MLRRWALRPRKHPEVEHCRSSLALFQRILFGFWSVAGPLVAWLGKFVGVKLHLVNQTIIFSPILVCCLLRCRRLCEFDAGQPFTSLTVQDWSHQAVQQATFVHPRTQCRRGLAALLSPHLVADEEGYNRDRT